MNYIIIISLWRADKSLGATSLSLLKCIQCSLVTPKLANIGNNKYWAVCLSNHLKIGFSLDKGVHFIRINFYLYKNHLQKCKV